jgi:hypothetical protein
VPSSQCLCGWPISDSPDPYRTTLDERGKQAAPDPSTAVPWGDNQFPGRHRSAVSLGIAEDLTILASDQVLDSRMTVSKVQQAGLVERVDAVGGGRFLDHREHSLSFSQAKSLGTRDLKAVNHGPTVVIDRLDFASCATATQVQR